MKSSEVTLLIKKERLRNISKSELDAIIEEYKQLLIKYPLLPPKEEEKDLIGMLKYLKRKDPNNPTIIGQYKNITVFEAANRIASDLVILKGVSKIINTEKFDHNNLKITIHLGTTHVADEGDFIINGEHGEAFNVAPSFFEDKLYNKTLKKWDNRKDKKGNSLTLKYILVNGDVVTDKDIEYLLNQKSIQLIKVDDWGEGV